MRSFLFKILLFSIPFVLLAVSFALLDPFKVVHLDEPVKSHNPVQINVDYLATEAYLRNRERLHYDAFIFGSSRTLAFRIAEWRRYIGGSVPFRFNANRENLLGVRGKLRLIDGLGDSVRHALLLVDAGLLESLANSERHLYIKHPRVSGDSWTTFYMTFFSAYLTDFFFVKFLDYRLFGKFRPYMNGAINDRRMIIDPETNDVFLPEYDEELASDEDAYYEVRRAIFEVRRRQNRLSRPVIGPPQRAALEEIAAAFRNHGTRAEVVVSPNYDQVPLHPDDREVLRELFGARRVHDYSGVNDITLNLHNYYEPHHFRPRVGAKILAEIYADVVPKPPSVTRSHAREARSVTDTRTCDARPRCAAGSPRWPRG